MNSDFTKLEFIYISCPHIGGQIPDSFFSLWKELTDALPV